MKKLFALCATALLTVMAATVAPTDAAHAREPARRPRAAIPAHPDPNHAAPPQAKPLRPIRRIAAAQAPQPPEVRKPRLAASRPPHWRNDGAAGKKPGTLVLHHTKYDGVIMALPLSLAHQAAIDDAKDAYLTIGQTSDIEVVSLDILSEHSAAISFRVRLNGRTRYGRIVAEHLGAKRDLAFVAVGAWPRAHDKQARKDFDHFTDSITLLRSK